jgi:hypothetical protein
MTDDNDSGKQPATIFGMPAMSVVFDGALALAMISAAVNTGRIVQRVEELDRSQQVVLSRLQVDEGTNASQQASLAANDAHYSDIVRRLDSIENKLDRSAKR